MSAAPASGSILQKLFAKLDHATVSTSPTIINGKNTWLVATAEGAGQPEKQLWRIGQHYNDYWSVLSLVTFEKMLETLKTFELEATRRAGMEGTDAEIAAKRLPVVKKDNVLRVIADEKVPPKYKLSIARTAVSLAAAFALVAGIGAGNHSTAEAQAVRTVPPATATVSVLPQAPASAVAAVIVPQAPVAGVVDFVYSTNSGTTRVGSGDMAFGIHFSKSSNDSIHLYNYDATVDRIARVKGAAPGQDIRFADYDSSSRAYTIETGETFMVKNKQGYYLQGRIRSIKDDSRGDAVDKVVFEYQINADKSDAFKALPLTGETAPVIKQAAALKLAP